MLFTEPLFIFLFLPALLGLYRVSPTWARNFLLLCASLLFYAWGERIYTAVLIFSILLNYLCGLAIGNASAAGRRRLLLWGAVTGNLLVLIAFKYARFLVANLDRALPFFGLAPLPLPSIHLPIGISFFTFMGMSYLMDIYRRQLKPERNPNTFALYITLFPHLIAGPIVRYSDIARELVARQISRPMFAEGIRRFIIGFGKKMIIANTVALPADSIFNLAPEQLTTGVAWLGVVCYTLQIYFDFSGYSDMAIGLARMFGFHFPENFNYPYISRSITEFWKRWHISLSTWFRDYLFFSLGVRGPRWRIYLNLLIVFFLCGLWHGASWNFVVWGLFHGSFLVIERFGLAAWLHRRPVALQHLYALLVVMTGWVFFRAETLGHALAFLKAMAGSSAAAAVAVAEYDPAYYLNTQLVLALCLGALGSLPVVPALRKRVTGWMAEMDGAPGVVMDASWRLTKLAALSAIFLASASLSAAGTYNPFIYFRF
ncbi:MAG TPA: MBOAT family O-acyltransferase [Pyrinomonadaceae bacterium]|jgi:alginate O-acetyltransferase complex protein AlgI|nr:MBOAT family O-acyltransferase [Pyrinomonadaceae bacterium]